MRVAISTDGGLVSAHFGRCPLFTLVDIENGRATKVEAVANPGHQPGLIPQFLRERGVECIVAGGMGARAVSLFEELGIRTIVGVSGMVGETIAHLEKGDLEGGESLCQPGAGKGYGLEKDGCDHVEGDEHGHRREGREGVKVCVTSQGEGLDSPVDPRFGRCRYFMIVDTDTLEFEAVPNPNVEKTGGAGIQSSQLAAEKGVGAVLTGNVGPNAFQALQAAGIGIFTGASGTVRKAVERYKKGELGLAPGATVAGKSE